MEPSLGQNPGYLGRSGGSRGNRRPWRIRGGYNGPDHRRNLDNFPNDEGRNNPYFHPMAGNAFPSGPRPAFDSRVQADPTWHPGHEQQQQQWGGQASYYSGRGYQARPKFPPGPTWRDRQVPAGFRATPLNPSAPAFVYQPAPPTNPPPPDTVRQNYPRQRGSGRPLYFKNFGRGGGAGSRGYGGPGSAHRADRCDAAPSPNGRSDQSVDVDRWVKPAEEPTVEDGLSGQVAEKVNIHHHEEKTRDMPESEQQNRKAFTKKYAGAATEDDGTQRERLTEDLFKGNCECMVCCDRIRQTHDVWSCNNCYHIFHLRCIKRWAQSSTAEGADEGWRCPGCQNVTEKFLNVYLCFCGKMRNPVWNRHDTPHSCGEQCSKKRLQQNCVHPCNILCHPGPCPPCGVYVDRSCPCGKEVKKVRCGQTKSFSCGQTCEQLMNCGIHICKLNCHTGECDSCSELVQRTCHCEKQTEEVPCTLETAGNARFSCGSKCGKMLDCQNHFCEQLCHAGSCEACQLSPSKVTHCPCGQTPLTAILEADQARKSCTNPIPVCDKLCNKILGCGPEDDHHACLSICHTGQCPPCALQSTRKCRCGFLKKEIPCSEITSDATIICEKRCNKKKHCGRHKCSQYCCIDTSHRCMLICGRKLSCGLHQCDDTCHLGNCPVCWNTSFQELTCHCGNAILYPPIPCGTRPPECKQSCTRRHSCSHPIQHNCHSETNCPPCTVLTSKWCYGQHELRTCIPCYQTNVCCGLPCNKPLPCGQHTCVQTCHEGPCVTEGFKCVQSCKNPRPQCGHPCGIPCHGGECPVQLCKTMVSVTCRCGNRTGTLPCAENLLAYQRLLSSAMASKHHTTDQGQTLDITDLTKDGGLKKNSTLDCNDDCSLIERNRRLALALQIRNPELTCKLKPPVYSDFLKEQMRQNGTFVSSVYNKLTELVQSAKQSKQKSRSHAFPTMKSDHRHIIHELAEFFGCETQSYDEEPKKNVVATAFRDKSWLPSTSIMAVIQKESGVTRQAGRAPPPVPHSHWNSSQSRSSSTTNVTTLVGINTPSKLESAPPIDYFDFTD